MVPAAIQTLNLTSIRVLYGAESRSPTNFRRLWRFLSSKGTKSSLVLIIYILKIINLCRDNVKHGKNCTDEWFYFSCVVITVGKIMLRHFTKKCMESRASKVFIKRFIWLLKFIGKGCSIFVSSAYITLISTKDIKYCMVPIRTSQAHNNRTN